jgi:cell division protease FtsH
MKDFEFAKDKVLMGSERRSMIISEEEKRLTAFHEAGHALLAAVEKEADPLHKVSIIPRGMALGVTQQLPLSDKYSYSKDYLEAQLRVLMAGRISEEIFLGTVTTGAGNDFDKATAISRQMVCEWGMSSLGPVRLGQKDDMLFLGKDLIYHNEYSEETARRIDEEISGIINDAYEKTKETILKYKDKLEKIANYLLERESLSSKEIDDIIHGIELEPINNHDNKTENEEKQDNKNSAETNPGKKSTVTVTTSSIANANAASSRR